MTLNQIIEANREWLTEKPRRRFTTITDHDGLQFRLFAEEADLGIFIAIENIYDKDVPFVDPAYNGFKTLFNSETGPA